VAEVTGAKLPTRNAWTNDEIEMLKMTAEAIEADGLRTGLYALSASEDGNSLSQWVHYAGLDGVAIGLDPKIPLHIPGADMLATLRDPNAWLNPGWIKMAYGERAHLAAIHSGFEAAVEEFRKNAASAQEYGWWGQEVILEGVSKAVLTVKHEAFASEAEQRFLLPLPKSLDQKFRVVGSQLVRYTVVRAGTPHQRDEQPPPIVRVRVGPTANADAERELRRFLASHGYSGVVDRSDIPYRGGPTII